MVESRTAGFRLGQVVAVVAGREAGRRFVVVGLDDRFLLLADGQRRRADQPKRKNPRHVRVIVGEDRPCQVPIGRPLTDEAVREVLRAIEEG